MVKDISQLTRDDITVLAESDYAAVPKLREQGDAWGEAARLARYVQSTLESRMSQRLGTSDTAAVRSLLKQIGGTGHASKSLASSAEQRATTLSDTADEAARLKTEVDRLNGEAAEAAGSHADDPDIAFQGYNGISDPDAGYQAYLSDVTDDMRSQVRLTSNAYDDQARMHHDAPVIEFTGPGEWTGPMPDRMPQPVPTGDSHAGQPHQGPIGGGTDAPDGYRTAGSVPDGSGGTAPVSSGHDGPDLQSGSAPATTAPGPATGGPAPIGSGGGTPPGPAPIPAATNPNGSPRPVTPPATGRPTPGGTGPATGSRPTPGLPPHRSSGPGGASGGRPATTMPAGQRSGTGLSTTPAGGRPVTNPPTGLRPDPTVPGGQGATTRPVPGQVTRTGATPPPGDLRTGRSATGVPAPVTNGQTATGAPGPSGGARPGTGGSANPGARPAGTGSVPPGSRAARSLLPNQRGEAVPGGDPTRQASRPAPAANRPATGGFTSSRTTVPSVIGGRSTPQPAAPRPRVSPGSLTGAVTGRVASRVGNRPKVATTAPAGKVIGARRPGAKSGVTDDRDQLRLRAESRRRFLDEVDSRKALAEGDSELMRGIDPTVVPGVITSSAAPNRVRRRDIGRVFGTGGWEG